MHQRVAGWTFAAVVAVALAGLTRFAHAEQACVTGFDPPELNLPASMVSSGPAFFNVLTSTPTCHWEFDGPPIPVWVLPLANVSGDGPQTVGFFAPTNPNTTSRSAVLTYGGRPITITQAGDPCQLTFSPNPVPMPAAGGTGSFTITATGSPCSYSAQPPSGVVIVSGGSGSTFPATVTFSIGPNTTQSVLNHRVTVSVTGSVATFPPVAGIVQNGPPITTDLTAPLVFALNRRASGPPYVSPPEPIRITNAEDPGASWTATTTQAWLVLSPSSGAGPATIAVSVDAAAVFGDAGTLSGTIDITSSVAPGSPRKVDVSLSLTNQAVPTAAPSGVVDIPINNSSGLSGAVPIGGWAVDDVGVVRVQIYRNSVAGEPLGLIYLGDATRVRGARPDVVAIWRTPGVRSAGWGFMILSNVFPNGGNGIVTLSAFADDAEGQRAFLGQKTVTFDNSNSPLPFGTIDLPPQGATVSGNIANHGWVLAQPNQGRLIPFDGSTIRLRLDGVERTAMANYGHNRPDVAALFPPPAYANGAGAGAYFLIDTLQLADGLHTMDWVVVDNLGAIEGIGSRYFTVANGGASQIAAASAPEARSAVEVRGLPPASTQMWVRRSFDDPLWSAEVESRGGQKEIRQARAELMEVTLDSWEWLFGCGSYSAYLVTGDTASPLPPGASLDVERGIFRWLPPPEFAGTFDFAFVRRGWDGTEARIPLRVIIGAESIQR